jgi:hypothetical protein
MKEQWNGRVETEKHVPRHIRKISFLWNTWYNSNQCLPVLQNWHLHQRELPDFGPHFWSLHLQDIPCIICSRTFQPWYLQLFTHIYIPEISFYCM